MGIQNIDERREYAYCIIAWLKCISAYVRTLRMTPTITHSLASHHHYAYYVMSGTFLSSDLMKELAGTSMNTADTKTVSQANPL
jgi:hypothetical protein